MEAARYGARILHGPNIDNFKEIYKKLNSIKIAIKISTPQKLASSIIFKKNRNIGKKIKNIGTKIFKKIIKSLIILLRMNLKKPKFWNLKSLIFLLTCYSHFQY